MTEGDLSLAAANTATHYGRSPSVFKSVKMTDSLKIFLSLLVTENILLTQPLLGSFYFMLIPLKVEGFLNMSLICQGRGHLFCSLLHSEFSQYLQNLSIYSR